MIFPVKALGGHLGFVHTRFGFHSVFIPSTAVFLASQIHLDCEIIEILSTYPEQQQLLAMLERCRTPEEFLTSLEEMLNSPLLSSRTEQLKIRASHIGETKMLQLLVSELDIIGWDKIVEVNDSFDFIKFSVMDSKGRQHAFDVKFGENFPLEAPIVTVSLPKKLHFNWPLSSVESVLVALYNFVIAEILRYEVYFEV